MPQDALLYNFIAKELDEKLKDGKIDKIIMPSCDTIALIIRARGKNNTLLISANPSLARLYLTSEVLVSRQTPPSFLMHMRKNIGNGKILSVENVPFERIIKINILSRSELGDEQNKTIVAEIMGKHSNIIILNENGIITECIKPISLDMSSKRQVLPSLRYTTAPPQDKVNPLDKQGLTRVLSGYTGDNLQKYLLANVSALAPSTIKEVIYNVFKNNAVQTLSADNIESLCNEFSALYDQNTLCACVKSDGVYALDTFIKPYNSIETQYIKCESVNDAMDKYFTDTADKARFNDKHRILLSSVSSAMTKLEKKLGTFLLAIENAKDYEQDKIYGEILTANIYKVRFGDSSLVADNYYTDPMEKITSPLNKAKSPSFNAQKFYKSYNKKKKTIELNTIQVENINKDIEYLESIKASLAIAETTSDLNDIEVELQDCGLIKNKNEKNSSKQAVKTTSGTKTTIFEGYTIYTGKNNVQNDTLVKNSAPNDVWLHTKDIHGSHTVIVNPKKSIPPENVLRHAAALTALYSKAKSSENVPVDYTFIKFVSKPKGAKLGRVIYTNQKTLYVNPAK